MPDPSPAESALLVALFRMSRRKHKPTIDTLIAAAIARTQAHFAPVTFHAALKRLERRNLVTLAYEWPRLTLDGLAVATSLACAEDDEAD